MLLGGGDRRIRREAAERPSRCWKLGGGGGGRGLLRRSAGEHDADSPPRRASAGPPGACAHAELGGWKMVDARTCALIDICEVVVVEAGTKNASGCEECWDVDHKTFSTCFCYLPRTRSAGGVRVRLGGASSQATAHATVTGRGLSSATTTLLIDPAQSSRTPAAAAAAPAAAPAPCAAPPPARAGPAAAAAAAAAAPWLINRSAGQVHDHAVCLHARSQLLRRQVGLLALLLLRAPRGLRQEAAPTHTAHTCHNSSGNRSPPAGCSEPVLMLTMTAAVLA
jgi:hypothetical protein